MDTALLALVVGPAGAAALLLTETEGARAVRRVLSLLGALAGVGGAAALLSLVLLDGPATARGLTLDPWRCGLALAIAATGAAGIVRSTEIDARATAGMLAVVGASSVSVLASDSVSAAALLLISTMGFGFVAWTTKSGGRALAWYAIGDLAAVLGLLLIASEGMRLPPRAFGAGAAALLVAAFIRSGAFPARALVDTVDGATPTAALAAGPLRVQGIAIAWWLATARPDATDWLMTGAALLAAWSARRGAQEGSFGWASAALSGLFLCALGAGGTAVLRGAVVLAAGAFVGTVVALLGRARAASPGLGAAPLGATLPGAALIAAALLERGTADAALLVPAAAAIGAFAWLAQAGVSGLSARDPSPSARAVWALLPAAALATIAVVPERALNAMTEAARALGASGGLGPLDGLITDELGLAFAAAAAGAVVAALPARAPAPDVPLPADPPARSVIGLAAFAAAWGSFAVLLWVGIDRGFL